MPDYYQQPEYLKELLEEPKTTVTTTTTTESSPSEPTEDKPRIPQKFIIIAVIVLILLVIVILILSSRRSSTPPVDTSKQVILQWWGVYLPKEVVQPLLDEYKSINSNVTIEYADKWPIGPYSDAVVNYRSELNRKVSAADVVETPDIFMVHNTWVDDYIKYAATPAATVTDASAYANTFYPVVANDFTEDNKVYGVPLWVDTFAILYNKDQLNAASVSAPPTDWTAFKNLARTLTQKTGSTLTRGGFAAGTGSNVTYASELFNLLMLQNGVEIVDSNGLPVFGSQTEATSALTFYKDFANNANYTWKDSADNDSKAFLEGKASMIFAPSYRYREIKNVNEDLDLGLDIGVAQVPQLSGQTEDLINWSDYWGNMVSSKRPNAAYAWDFLNWMTQSAQLDKLNNNLEEVTGQFGIMSPRKDMNSFLTDDNDLKIFAESLPFAKSWQMVKGIEVEELFVELLDTSTPGANNITSTQNDIVPLVSSAGQLQQ
jgi:ABC-type glycerol-3-phosphate transport system substrate-binding protein